MDRQKLHRVEETLAQFRSVSDISDQYALVPELSAELEKLDSGLDVDKADRKEFARHRSGIRTFAKHAGDNNRAWLHIDAMRQIIVRALAAPVPPAESGSPTVKDLGFRALLDRDLAEAELLFENRFFKPSSVFAGGVLEALLYEYLLRNPAWTMDPARRAIPSYRPGRGAPPQPKAITSADLREQWTLQELIEFACANGLVNSYNAPALHDTLRDPRNFIHPMKEIRSGQTIDEHIAKVSLAMIQAIVAEIGRLPDPT